MDKESTRNTIAFGVIAMAILLAYQVFVLGPIDKRRAAERARQTAVAAQSNSPQLAPPGAPVLISREAAVAQSPRLPVRTPSLTGSVSLRGARIDDLFITRHRATADPRSGPVELFRPEGAKQAYFADFGWSGAAGLPTGATLWTKTAGDELAPGRPVTLRFDNGQGLVFTRTVAVDRDYMFTLTDAVENHGAQPVRLAPYASVQRQGRPQPTVGIFEGAIGAQAGVLQLADFKTLKEKPAVQIAGQGGWFGLTDKYWMAAVIPGQGEAVRAVYRDTPVGDVDVYEANYVGPVRTLAPGARTVEARRLFAGAKEAAVLTAYEKALGLPKFSDAIDWGRLWFLTRPIFALLTTFQGLTGSIGIAILMLTVVRVILTFPLYNRSFASQAEMRKLLPEVNAIKARFPDDAAKQQQATMELYKAKKVNPLAGCLPALVPIPVFFALSKVFTVSIEMRHARFLGVPDLSAPEPDSFVNLFGLIPWHVASTPGIGGFLDGPLHIGLIAILYGGTQFLLQSMSPQTQNIDPAQKQIFQLMPVIITFFMARVASGLLIYWVWSTLLTIVQQYVIMHRHGTQNPIDNLLGRLRGQAPVAA